MKKTIDFLVLGAQKSGTTTLFKYMQHHPQLYLPAQKETHFFVSEDGTSEGLSWYLQTYFAGADERKRWGEVCPSYMGYRVAPERIHAMCPDARLVAILRNPVDRAYSHYRMAVRRGVESRTFRQAVEDLRGRRGGSPETKVWDDAPFVLEFSRYGRSLERYLRYFDREQMLVLFQEDLVSHPEALLATLLPFLEVDASYRPPNLGREYHVGGEKRLPWLDDLVRRRRILKRVVKKALGSKANVQAARFWFKQLNIKPVRDEGPSPEDRDLLQEVLREDVALLKRLFSVQPPWPEFEGAKSRNAATQE